MAVTRHVATRHHGTTHDTPFVRVSEAASTLELSRGRVYALIAEGKIPAVRDGRRVRIPRGSWAAWLRAQEQRALENLREPIDRTTDAIALHPDDIARLQPAVENGNQR